MSFTHKNVKKKKKTLAGTHIFNANIYKIFIDYKFDETLNAY